LFGGLIIGIVWLLFCVFNDDLNSGLAGVAIGTFAGFLGSLVCSNSNSLTLTFFDQMDSFLGATVQYSGFSKSLGRVVNVPTSDSKLICGFDLLSNNQVQYVEIFTH
jgi:uncharacterized membrane protein